MHSLCNDDFKLTGVCSRGTIALNYILAFKVCRCVVCGPQGYAIHRGYQCSPEDQFFGPFTSPLFPMRPESDAHIMVWIK